MADEKMTKEKLLARREAARKLQEENQFGSIEDHMRRHPWMSREDAEELFRVNAMSSEEQDAYYEASTKKQLKQNLMHIEGVDEAMAQRLVEGGVMYFHTIASSLPFEQFHDIAHRMIGSPAAGC